MNRRALFPKGGMTNSINMLYSPLIYHVSTEDIAHTTKYPFSKERSTTSSQFFQPKLKQIEPQNIIQNKSYDINSSLGIIPLRNSSADAGSINPISEPASQKKRKAHKKKLYKQASIATDLIEFKNKNMRSYPSYVDHQEEKKQDNDINFKSFEQNKLRAYSQDKILERKSRQNSQYQEKSRNTEKYIKQRGTYENTNEEGNNDEHMIKVQKVQNDDILPEIRVKSNSYGSKTQSTFYKQHQNDNGLIKQDDIHDENNNNNLSQDRILTPEEEKDKDEINQNDQLDKKSLNNSNSSSKSIGKVQELLMQAQKEEQNKKKKQKKPLFVGTLDDKIYHSPEEGFENDILVFGQDDKKLMKRISLDKKVDLESFRLKRRYSDEERQAQKDQQKDAANNQDGSLNSNNTNHHNHFNSSNSNNVNPTKKLSMKGDFGELDVQTRLGMEKWKTSKLQLGEFLWNARISQLKASIKKKMPAYSTKLLQKWEDCTFDPVTYTAKRSPQSHQIYQQVNYKSSFSFYNPHSNKQISQNTGVILPNRQFLNSRGSQSQLQIQKYNNNNSSYNLSSQKIDFIKQSLNTNNNDSVMQNNTNNISLLKDNNKSQDNITNQKSTFSIMMKRAVPLRSEQSNEIIQTSQIQNIKEEDERQQLKSQQQRISFSQSSSHFFGKPRASHQDEYFSLKKQVVAQKTQVEAMDKKIHEIKEQIRINPIIPKELIEKAKRQTHNSFFEIKDLKKEKKTLKFFDQTPSYQTQEKTDTVLFLKKMKQRSDTYKTFKGHLQMFISSQNNINNS